MRGGTGRHRRAAWPRGRGGGDRPGVRRRRPLRSGDEARVADEGGRLLIPRASSDAGTGSSYTSAEPDLAGHVTITAWPKGVNHGPSSAREGERCQEPFFKTS